MVVDKPRARRIDIVDGSILPEVSNSRGSGHYGLLWGLNGQTNEGRCGLLLLHALGFDKVRRRLRVQCRRAGIAPVSKKTWLRSFNDSNICLLLISVLLSRVGQLVLASVGACTGHISDSRLQTPDSISKRHVYSGPSGLQVNVYGRKKTQALQSTQVLTTICS